MEEKEAGSGPEKGPERHSKMSASQKSRRKEGQSPSAAGKDSQQWQEEFQGVGERVRGRMWRADNQGAQATGRSGCKQAGN